MSEAVANEITDEEVQTAVRSAFMFLAACVAGRVKEATLSDQDVTAMAIALD